jgi:hypothetical protein
MSHTNETNGSLPCGDSSSRTTTDSGAVLGNLLSRKRKSDDAVPSPTLSRRDAAIEQLSPQQLSTIEKAKTGVYFPPKRSVKGNLVIAKDQIIVKRMRDDGFEAQIGTNTDAEMILRCLYGRDFLEEDKEHRERELTLMVAPKEKKNRKRALYFVRLDGDITTNQSALSERQRKHSVDRATCKKIADSHGTEEEMRG